MTQFSFDASKFITPNAEVIPAGDYPVVIIDVERRATRSRDGFYVQVAYQVESGEHAQRVVFDRFHLESRVLATTAIASREFAKLCTAVGIAKLDRLEHLRNQRLVVSVTARHNDRSGTLVNSVTGYAPALAIPKRAGTRRNSA